MKHSRRGTITDLLREGKSDPEILGVLDKKFPPGSLATSNKAALAGTKWDLEKSGTRVVREKSMHIPKPAQLANSLHRDELVAKLRSFESNPIVERYRARDLAGKSPKELLAFTVDNTIYRAFHHETPSLRYAQWRWHARAEQLSKELNAISSQMAFDRFALELGESLVADWGEKTDRGEPSKMNIGVAMKITNLALKHFTFSSLGRNPSLIEWLHVPWDSFTLLPLRKIWVGQPSIPNTPSQGFVKNLAMYQQLHALISDITQEAGIARIYYEFWAWDTAH
ncbi:MAG: hypothetical protein HWD57_19260 [Candidatus Accumulibacter cognatus]|uniref:Uncharacterized protein n=1 Tax=Candidatus Accumulibacter cognatus TaxID=2954383 RepID=A0A7D5NBX2_9PROT|nr:MAG: hypothetical protein HWD57_19260 [Candidatus Accumulibacter cognatus]